MTDTSIFGSVLAGVNATATATTDLAQNVQSAFLLYNATAGGTGYSSGDILARITLTDISVTPNTSVAIWQNLTTGDTLSAMPSGGTYTARGDAVKVTDGTNILTLKDISIQVTAGDIGVVSNSIIHGKTTAGGGSYVDVKVTPSGALSIALDLGIWYDDTSTALGSSATFTSTARDITATASGSSFPTSSFASEYRVLAMQDQAFTLQIEASRDNSNWYPVQSITAATVSTNYVAEAVVVPKTRYYRYLIVNGGTAAAYTIGQSILTS